MRFIITLIALLLERFFELDHLRNWQHFDRFQRWVALKTKQPSGTALLLASILPVVLVVALTNHLLGAWLFGLPKLLFGVVVLLACLGPRNFWVEAYAAFTGLQTSDQTTSIAMLTKLGVAWDESPRIFHVGFVQALFGEANRRVFAPLFWFVVLGPAGAVLYRCIDISRVNKCAGASDVQLWLDWLPIRLLTLTFALGGHFTRVLAIWRAKAMSPAEANHALLGDCGCAALNTSFDGLKSEESSAEKEALSLVDRALLIEMVILALIVLL